MPCGISMTATPAAFVRAVFCKYTESETMTSSLLTLNAGSSSLKFALFDLGGGEPDEACFGQIEGLGGAARFSVRLLKGRAEPPFHSEGNRVDAS